MRLEALVPVKGLQAGKGRLAGFLADGERRRLIRTMLRDVLASLEATPGIARIRILSGDPRLSVRGYESITDGGAGLNGALHCCAIELAREGAAGLLVVPGDVPLATPAEFAAVVTALRQHALVLVSDAAGIGTNTLALRPPTSIVPCFGAASRAAHAAAAAVAGHTLHLLDAPGLAHDVDAPRDLEYLLARRPARYSFLRRDLRRAC